MNKMQTKIKVEVGEFGYHLVQRLTFVYHFFTEIAQQALNLFPLSISSSLSNLATGICNTSVHSFFPESNISMVKALNM